MTNIGFKQIWSQKYPHLLKLKIVACTYIIFQIDVACFVDAMSGFNKCLKLNVILDLYLNDLIRMNRCGVFD